MKKRSLRGISLVLVLLLAASAPGCSPAAPAAGQGASPGTAGEPELLTEPLTLRYGCTSSLKPDDVVRPGVDYFVEQIHAQSDNQRITIETYGNSQLGSEASMLEQLMMGDLDMGHINVSALSTVWPEFSAVGLPFAFPDNGACWDVLFDEEVLSSLRKKVDSKGLVRMINPTFGIFRGFQNAVRDVRSAEDVKGLKIRVMAGQLYADQYSSLGATTSVIGMGDLYTSLQQGVVNADEVGFAMWYNYNLYELEKHMTELNANMSVNVMIVSEKAWNKLSEREKQLFYDISAEMHVICDEAIAENWEDILGKLREQGVTIIENKDLTAEERQSFIDATSWIWDDYEDKMDPEFYRLFVSKREEVLKAKGYA